MQFLTRSGSRYQIDVQAGTLTRLAEHPLVDTAGFRLPGMLVRFARIEHAFVAEGAPAVIDLVDGPRITTTRVVEIIP